MREEWVFSLRHFLDLASHPAITSALRRQTEAGTISQLGRGLLDYPKLPLSIGHLSPTPEARSRRQLRDAIASGSSRPAPMAANLLGLSEQVPAKVLTNGPSRAVQVGPTTLQLPHTTPRNLAAAGRPSGRVIHAYRHPGPEQVTPERITRLRRTLPTDDRRTLLRDLTLAPELMHHRLKELAAS